MVESYEQESLRNALMTHFTNTDLVVVHDPQPLAMIDNMPKKQPWVWRLHIDVSNPHEPVWEYLSQYVRDYDGMVVSMDRYKKGVLPNEHIIAPSIDPISAKNEELSEREAREIIEDEGISMDKPIITQISRFDKWKDPIGVISIYEKVKKEEDCQLVLMGDMAADDPEGQQIYVDVVNRADGREDIHIITRRDDTLVNALQKMSHVVIQNSKKEGFGLVVAEALWKRTPVVTRPSGGIPLQVIDGENGYLINDEDEAAERVIELLRDDAKRDKMGWAGRKHVKKNFLITRHLMDYLELYDFYINEYDS
jgi:trehalose synthase